MVKANSKTGARTNLTAGYMLPWKQLMQATGIFPWAYRRQIILYSRASGNLLDCHCHGPHRDSIPSASHSKAVRFELPIGEPIAIG